MMNERIRRDGRNAFLSFVVTFNQTNRVHQKDGYLIRVLETGAVRLD